MIADRRPSTPAKGYAARTGVKALTAWAAALRMLSPVSREPVGGVDEPVGRVGDGGAGDHLVPV